MSSPAPRALDSVLLNAALWAVNPLRKPVRVRTSDRRYIRYVRWLQAMRPDVFLQPSDYGAPGYVSGADVEIGATWKRTGE